MSYLHAKIVKGQFWQNEAKIINLFNNRRPSGRGRGAQTLLTALMQKSPLSILIRCHLSDRVPA
jgi:hypothetical protein